MTPVEREIHEGETLAPEEPETGPVRRESARTAASTPGRGQPAVDELSEGGGENTDVLQDAHQERGEDRTALSAEELAAERPLTRHANESEKETSAGVHTNRERQTLQHRATHPKAERFPASQETAGEAEDAVADSTQETQIDSTAYAAEEDDSR